MLPNNSQERKDTPVFSGALMYFPLAIAYVAKISKIGNDKHNPGQPLHWSKDKSKDHADCVSRHLIDIGPNWEGADEEDILHAGYLAWRSLALLQTVLERRDLSGVSDDKPVAIPLLRSPHNYNGGHPCAVPGCDCTLTKSNCICSCHPDITGI